MIEERLFDSERRRIIALLIDAMPRKGRDRQLNAMIRKLSGVDTVVKVERAYPSSQSKTVDEVVSTLHRIEADDE